MIGTTGEPDCLVDLALAVRKKNVADGRVARLLCRPALPGHFGEFVASQVFGIELYLNAARPRSDGVFRGGELGGKSVNIKYYTKHDGLLNMSKDGKTEPDYYLVMTGPKEKAESSRGKTRPWVIESVFVFNAAALVRELLRRNPTKKIGVAAGVPKDLWEAAMIYPDGVSSLLSVTDVQRGLLALFAADAVG